MLTKVPLDLKELAEKVSKEDGLFIQGLNSGDVVRVETADNLYYELNILLPKEKTAWVISNNPYILGGTVMRIQGSRLTEFGTSIRDGWIAIGYRLEINSWVLMPVKRVTVNGFNIFTGPEYHIQ